MRDEVSTERRVALRVLCGAGAAALAMGLSACSLSVSADVPQVRIPISELPIGVRVRVVSGGHPVEVLRTTEGITARSLLCTHMGCEVRWNQGLRTYNCPCHGGVYSADGVVVAGPPGRALRSVPVRIEGDAVVLGG